MKIWLYYANFGGGHREAAQAVARALQAKYIDVEITFIDAAQSTGPVAKYWFEKGYAFLINRADWLYRILYQVSKWRLVMWLEIFFTALAGKKYLVEELKKNKPDIVVATYFLVEPLRVALATLALRVPVVMIVTDPFTAHPIWFYNQQFTHIVFSQELRQDIVRRLLKPDKALLFPQLINNLPLSVTAISALEKIKQQYNFPANKKIVLMVGGENGFPGGKRVLKGLIEANIDAVIVVVCGTDKYLKAMADVLRQGREEKLFVFGFVDFLPELMAAADVFVIKAGAGVVMEGVLQKKPLVVAHYIWEQEKGNVEFVVRQGLGFYEPRVKNLVEKVRACLFDESVRVKIKLAYASLAFEPGNEKIADFIYSLGKK